MDRMPRAVAARASALTCCFLVLCTSAVSDPTAGPTSETTPQPSSCIVIQAAPWGLCSTFDTMMHYLATRPNETVYFDYSPSPYQCPSKTTKAGREIKGWELLFSGSLPRVWPGPSQRCGEVFNSMQVATRDGQYKRYLEQKYNLSHTHIIGITLPTDAEERGRRNEAYAEYMSVLCPVVRQVWQFSQTMHTLVSYELGNIRLLPHPIIAVHVRGGDKLAGSEVPQGFRYDWNGTFQKLGSTVGEQKGTCIIVGDDSTEAAKAVAAAEAFVGCSVVNRVPPAHQHHQSKFNSESPQSRCHRTQKFLVELEILASADYTVGSVHSNVNLIAHLVKICVHGGKEESYLDLNSDDGHKIIMPRVP